jgi:hypothetical protein
MKILAAIVSDKNSEALVTNTLRWAGRAGFNMRIFIPDKRQLNKYMKAVDDANYKYYLDIPYTCIETGDPLEFAKREGFDLLVKLPDDLKYWGISEHEDLTVLQYQEEISQQRGLFSKYPKRLFKIFPNKASIQRVQIANKTTPLPRSNKKIKNNNRGEGISRGVSRAGQGG